MCIAASMGEETRTWFMNFSDIWRKLPRNTMSFFQSWCKNFDNPLIWYLLNIYHDYVSEGNLPILWCYLFCYYIMHLCIHAHDLCNHLCIIVSTFRGRINRKDYAPFVKPRSNWAFKLSNSKPLVTSQHASSLAWPVCSHRLGAANWFVPNQT